MQKEPESTRGYGSLATALGNNEHWAFEEIYRENYPAVEAFVLKNSGSCDEAKDLFQDAVILVWQKIRDGSFVDQQQNSVGALIFQVVRFKWYDKLKSAQHRNTQPLQNFHLMNTAEDALPDLEKSCGLIDTSKDISQHISKLGDKCKSLLLAFYYERLSMKAIGKKFGYEPESVRTLKYRCMKKLRQLYLSHKHEKD